MRKTGETNGIFKKIFEPFKITDRVKERESFSKELGIKVNIQHVHFQSQSTATLTLLKIPSFAFDPGHHFSKKKIEYEQRFLALRKKSLIVESQFFYSISFKTGRVQHAGLQFIECPGKNWLQVDN